MNVEKNQEFFNADNELDYFHQIPYMLRSYLAFSLGALTGLGAEEVLKIYNSEPTNHYDNYNEYAEERDYEGDYDCYGDDYDDY
ncbi:hypothetical protein FIU87_19340 [Bacillus sp. THAF10]|uniref:hypothetical protein n=1 Tax=Bacillus sp. THAF10 TaxID=2587848 RepID=UPI0012695373|nr:hypothetical protein [Bacillus sp. THAF10]QFT90804.1 hypothetical protein FIU87_19340 [Bacillus sp. THAF10]